MNHFIIHLMHTT